jgi:hypothetical protein
MPGPVLQHGESIELLMTAFELLCGNNMVLDGRRLPILRRFPLNVMAEAAIASEATSRDTIVSGLIPPNKDSSKRGRGVDSWPIAGTPDLWR